MLGLLSLTELINAVNEEATLRSYLHLKALQVFMMEVLKRSISQHTKQRIHHDIFTYVLHCSFSIFAFLSSMISTPVNNILLVAASAVYRTPPFFSFLPFMFIFITRKERHVEKKESYSPIN